MQEKGWLDEQFIVNIGEGNSIDTVEHTADTLQPIIKRLQPTAVFCCNDLMGIGAQNACQRLGLRVPEDISVMGYDNSSLARLVEPKLTTMDQNMHQLGQNAAPAGAECRLPAARQHQGGQEPPYHVAEYARRAPFCRILQKKRGLTLAKRREKEYNYMRTLWRMHIAGVVHR